MSYRSYIRSQILEIARDCSAFGSLLFVLLASVAMAFFDKALSIKLLLGLFIVEAIGSLIKLLFFRHRPDRQPYVNFIEKIDAGGFPSLHSARITVLAVAVGAQSHPAAAFGIPLVLLVGWSRMALRKHYLMDVVAGYILGLTAGCLGRWLV